MSHDAAKQIEREYDKMCKTTPLFKEFVEFCPSASMEESLESWKWVQSLVTKVIQRTIRDLTSPPPPPKITSSREEKAS